MSEATSEVAVRESEGLAEEREIRENEKNNAVAAGNIIGKIYSALDEPRLRAICFIKANRAASFSQLQRIMNLGAGAATNALGNLIEADLVLRVGPKKKPEYILSDLGNISFRAFYNLWTDVKEIRRPPPHLDRSHYERAKVLADMVERAVKDSKFRDAETARSR